jgi:hypothetical protein
MLNIHTYIHHEELCVRALAARDEMTEQTGGKVNTDSTAQRKRTMQRK